MSYSINGFTISHSSSLLVKVILTKLFLMWYLIIECEFNRGLAKVSKQKQEPEIQAPVFIINMFSILI
jgi:hypothetical protein